MTVLYDKRRLIVRPSQLVQDLLYLGDQQPFSIADYPYLHQIYDTDAREVCLFTGRQVSKSTYLASKMLTNVPFLPDGRQILVSPLMDQSTEFSVQRLRPFIEHSPVLKAMMSGDYKIDQVLRKGFCNRHVIALGYAQRTADRLRGQSIKDNGVLGFDEIQDILPEVIPVVKEMAFRAKNVSYLYCGTPKSLSNHMETKYRAFSTGNEWAVKCTHCNHWNLRWDEENIGNTGIVCRRCKGSINTNTGQWVSARKMDLHAGLAARVTKESFRIPQLIVKPIMDDPLKFRELLDKLRGYSQEKFYNEVLGLPYDSAAQPIKLEQILACCDKNLSNRIPEPDEPGVPPLVMGVDWAFLAENSFTYVTIGGWTSFPHKFKLYYAKIFRGPEADSEYQVKWILETVQKYGIKMVCADWGAGHVQNLQLVRALGEERVAQVWHTALKSKGAVGERARWHPKSRKWHLARTRVMTDTFESLRRGEITLPKAEEISHLIDHTLAIQMELRPETNIPFYNNLSPDDGFHSLTFCMLGSELYTRGDFAGHGGSPSVSAVDSLVLHGDDELAMAQAEIDIYGG